MISRHILLTRKKKKKMHDFSNIFVLDLTTNVELSRMKMYLYKNKDNLENINLHNKIHINIFFINKIIFYNLCPISQCIQ